MTGINEKLISDQAKRKRGPKPGPRKPRTSSTPRRRNARPGEGAKSLVSAVNTRFKNDPDEIVDALVKNVTAGNLPSARLLVELANASAPPPVEEKKGPTGHFSFAEYLESEPEYHLPPPGSTWVNDHWENPDADPEELAYVNSFEQINQHLEFLSKPRPALEAALCYSFEHPDEEIAPDPSRYHPGRSRD